MRIIYSPHFMRAYKKLSPALWEKARIAEKLFRENPFNPQLKMHKLGGELRFAWAFSIDARYRIVCEFLKNGDVSFYKIGDHSVYQ
ncbi:MAG: type II toxin-antitoxin system mRNA interferase toxin, RelE/StbE family [bacterium]|nr:type II toxin-antitoxin system mRNA interferase toxin, RelE/StbE family [bacterium]